MFKRLVLFLLCFALCFGITSCNEKAFSHCEMTISLSDEFVRVYSESFDAAFSDGTLSIALMRISFEAAELDGIPISLSSTNFAKFWLLNSRGSSEVFIHNGVDCAEYKDTENGVEYATVSAFYRSKYAYFVVIFTVADAYFNSYRDSIYSYISNIYFTDTK